MSGDSPESGGLNRVLVSNIRALLEKRRAEERSEGLQHRATDAVTRFAGSMPFVYLHAIVFGGWIAINLGWTSLPRFDPTFVVLATAASVEAIFLSTFVLITQNRLSKMSERRADLDLQISLLAEHEITKLLRISLAIAKHQGVEFPQEEELDELQQDVAPGRVWDTLEQETRFEP